MQENKEDKSALLNKLKFERALETEFTTLSWPIISLLMLLALISGGTASHFLFGGSQESKAQNLLSDSDLQSQQIETPDKGTINPEKTHLPDKNKTILNASGYITARRMATVSAQIMGLIKTVNVEEGMAVKEGQILAHLDDTIAKVNLEQAKATVQVLRAQLNAQLSSLNEAKRQYQRILNNQYLSDAKKTQTGTDLETAQASVSQMKANLKVALIDVKKQQKFLEHYTIRAPFSGVVTMKNAQPGEIVAPSSAGGGFTRTGICTIVDMDSLEIEVDVNESFIGRVYAGQKVEANLDAYQDWTIPASVIAIIPTADRGKATVSVRIRIEIKDPRILPEMGVKVAFLK